MTNDTGEQLRLLLVTDMGLFREGLAQMLGGHPSIAVVMTASCMADAMACAHQIQPHVTIVDASLLNAEVVAALMHRANNTRVVAFGVADDWDDVLACARAGAAGYVTRDSSITDLIEAVHGAHRGELRCSPRIAARMFEHMNSLLSNGKTPSSDRDLTVREVEIAELLERGLSNKEIARQLFIEQATVKNHVHNILAKLQVTRRGEAAAHLRRATTRSKKVR